MNWHERIERAREAGWFSNDDWRLARNYVTCACGEQDPRIPRNELTGQPIDDELAILGMDFYDNVTDGEIDRAGEVLAKIEIRAAEILEGMGVK